MNLMLLENIYYVIYHCLTVLLTLTVESTKIRWKKVLETSNHYEISNKKFLSNSGYLEPFSQVLWELGVLYNRSLLNFQRCDNTNSGQF